MIGQTVVQTLLCPFIHHLTIVTGHRHNEITQTIEKDITSFHLLLAPSRHKQVNSLRFVHNAAYKDGLSTSIRAAIENLPPPSPSTALFIVLADMPLITRGHFQQLFDAIPPHNTWDAIIPLYKNQQGHPVLWHPRHLPSLRALKGDQGGKSLLQRARMRVITVQLSHEILKDYDTPQDLEEFAKQAKFT